MVNTPSLREIHRSKLRVIRTVMLHLAGKTCQLRAHSTSGPTIYALTIINNRLGGAAWVGPVTNANDLNRSWPRSARVAARAVFKNPNFAHISTVAVIVTAKVGRAVHYAFVTIPPEPVKSNALSQPMPPQSYTAE